MDIKPEQMIGNKHIIQDFIKHPGMGLLVAKLNQKLDMKRQAWLNATTPEEAELIRQNGRAYAALMGTLNEFLAHGTQAEKLVAQRANTNDDIHSDHSSKGQ